MIPETFTAFDVLVAMIVSALVTGCVTHYFTAKQTQLVTMRDVVAKLRNSTVTTDD